MPRRPKLRIARDGALTTYTEYRFAVGGEGQWRIGLEGGGYWDTDAKRDGGASFIVYPDDLHVLWPHLKLKPGDGPREVNPNTMRFVD